MRIMRIVRIVRIVRIKKRGKEDGGKRKNRSAQN